MTRTLSTTASIVVNHTLQENFIRPDEAELAKAKVKFKGQHRIIDKVEARLADNRFWATLTNFNDKLGPHPR